MAVQATLVVVEVAGFPSDCRCSELFEVGLIVDGASLVLVFGHGSVGQLRRRDHSRNERGFELVSVEV